MTATMSECGAYRYSLERELSGLGRNPVVFVMLNPSTADANADDPTIRRCCGFAKRWGHDRIVVVNLYALRSTDPRALRTHPNPIGTHNDDAIYAAALRGPVVCAWGVHGEKDRVNAVRLLLAVAKAKPLCLGLTKSGAPRHPLYAPYGDAVPFPVARPR